MTITSNKVKSVVSSSFIKSSSSGSASTFSRCLMIPSVAWTEKLETVRYPLYPHCTHLDSPVATDSSNGSHLHKVQHFLQHGHDVLEVPGGKIFSDLEGGEVKYCLKVVWGKNSPGIRSLHCSWWGIRWPDPRRPLDCYNFKIFLL